MSRERRKGERVGIGWTMLVNDPMGKLMPVMISKDQPPQEATTEDIVEFINQYWDEKNKQGKQNRLMNLQEANLMQRLP